MPPTAATAHNGIGDAKPGTPEIVAVAKLVSGIEVTVVAITLGCDFFLLYKSYGYASHELINGWRNIAERRRRRLGNG